ncbi:hypothetical protein C8F04DRAFT_1314154 [Mycena alexandri]|uniref:Uncharacterized protein n=1 Tax=Mycena alexandri TaxID=1745969 RepID=A0AAD6T7C1_9AGAR|nr:hypothetical protein C8F04DRAFT_1314154 [Mycena alexandri]
MFVGPQHGLALSRTGGVCIISAMNTFYRKQMRTLRCQALCTSVGGGMGAVSQKHVDVYITVCKLHGPWLGPESNRRGLHHIDQHLPEKADADRSLPSLMHLCGRWDKWTSWLGPESNRRGLHHIDQHLPEKADADRPLPSLIPLTQNLDSLQEKYIVRAGKKAWWIFMAHGLALNRTGGVCSIFCPLGEKAVPLLQKNVKIKVAYFPNSEQVLIDLMVEMK